MEKLLLLLLLLLHNRVYFGVIVGNLGMHFIGVT